MTTIIIIIISVGLMLLLEGKDTSICGDRIYILTLSSMGGTDYWSTGHI